VKLTDELLSLTLVSIIVLTVELPVTIEFAKYPDILLTVLLVIIVFPIKIEVEFTTAFTEELPIETRASTVNVFVDIMLAVNVPVMAAFKGMRARRKKPTENVEDFARTLERNGLPVTAQKIREAAALI
jgi:hypothetical protein